MGSEDLAADLFGALEALRRAATLCTHRRCAHDFEGAHGLVFARTLQAYLIPAFPRQSKRELTLWEVKLVKLGLVEPGKGVQAVSLDSAVKIATIRKALAELPPPRRRRRRKTT